MAMARCGDGGIESLAKLDRALVKVELGGHDKVARAIAHGYWNRLEFEARRMQLEGGNGVRTSGGHEHQRRQVHARWKCGR